VRRLIAIAALVSLSLVGGYAADKDSDDTAAAAKTRKLLKEKVTVDFKDTRLEDAMDELKDQVKGLKILLDTKGGVSRNRTLTFQAKEVTVEDALDGMFKKVGLGYVVISKKNNAYDGAVQIRASKERGYPEKSEDK
jgi:hypothetical protein